MPPAVENALSSALEPVAAVCTVPWIVAPRTGAEGAVGEVADELHPAAPSSRARAGSETSTRRSAFIETSFAIRPGGSAGPAGGLRGSASPGFPGFALSRSGRGLVPRVQSSFLPAAAGSAVRRSLSPLQREVLQEAAEGHVQPPGRFGLEGSRDPLRSFPVVPG